MSDDFIRSGKISIIIPALNEEKLIRNLLEQFDDSIRSQFDIELIVSDGGSNDRTVEIAERYADKVLIYDKAYLQNISRGRNDGAEISRGDVLIFLNADTRIKDLNHLLRESVTEICENSVGAIACPVYVYPEEEVLSDKIFHYLYNKYTNLLVRFFMGMGRGECQIVSRKIFAECGGYDNGIIAGEDFELYTRIKKKGRLIFRKDFIVYESPRRYRRYGYLKILGEWTKNSLSVYFMKRSVSAKWEEVR